MSSNPYRYSGPQTPEDNAIAIQPRIESVQKVSEGLTMGEYWVVQGPRQIGKSTFLNLIRKELNQTATCIYIDLETAPKDEESFSKFMAAHTVKTLSSIISEAENPNEIESIFDLSYFLADLKLNNPQKIIFLFDNIESLPFSVVFLKMWRQIHNERNFNPSLNKYSIILTSSQNLINLSYGPNSPFNIAMLLYLEDFTKEESENLIDKPIAKFSIKIESKAKEHLLDHIAGHPQMLQHACHLLVETALQNSSPLTKIDIINTIETLINENSLLETVAKDIESNDQLKQLVCGIINGEQISHYPNKDFTFSGAGVIVNRDGICAIRNKVFEEYIKRKVL